MHCKSRHAHGKPFIERLNRSLKEALETLPGCTRLDAVDGILFGVPRLERLFASNEQLRLRASARREFRPYNFQSIEEQRAFASCVRTYSGLFSQSGWPIEVPHDVLVRHCYLLCGGLVGVLSRFMQELACQMAYEAPRGLTFADCAATVQLIEGAGHPHCPPFFQETVSAIELNQAHAHVLEISEMPMRKVLS
jgi:hypothetical protein